MDVDACPYVSAVSATFPLTLLGCRSRYRTIPMEPSELTDIFGMPIEGTSDSHDAGPELSDGSRDAAVTETPFRFTDFLLLELISFAVIIAAAVATAERELGDFTFWLPVQVAGSLLALAAVKRRRRTSWTAFGFPLQWKYSWGLFTGLPLLIVVTLLLLPISTRITEDNNIVSDDLLSVDGSLEYLAAILGVVIFIPLVEELFFRGVLQPALRRRMGAVGAVFASAALFGLVHGFNIDPSSEQLFLEITATVGGIFLFALVLGWAREATKGISLPFFLHAGWNAVVTAALFLGPENLS